MLSWTDEAKVLLVTVGIAEGRAVFVVVVPAWVVAAAADGLERVVDVVGFVASGWRPAVVEALELVVGPEGVVVVNMTVVGWEASLVWSSLAEVGDESGRLGVVADVGRVWTMDAVEGLMDLPDDVGAAEVCSDVKGPRGTVGPGVVCCTKVVDRAGTDVVEAAVDGSVAVVVVDKEAELEIWPEAARVGSPPSVESVAVVDTMGAAVVVVIVTVLVEVSEKTRTVDSVAAAAVLPAFLLADEAVAASRTGNSALDPCPGS